jgi:hypothetical protein
MYCMTPRGGRGKAGEVEAATVQHPRLIGRQALGNITALAIICAWGLYIEIIP